MKRQPKHFYEFGSFRLDPAEHNLLQENTIIPLTPKVFDTLLVLVENKGHLVEKDELLKEVWSDTIVEESNLAKNISILRKVFFENGTEETYIETVPKLGYRFVAPVKKINGDVSPSEEKVRKVDSPKANRTKFLVVTPILLLVVLAVGYFLYLNSSRTPVLTDKDFILLTDFENKTGEKIFDGTLKQALRVALQQSSFLSIFSDSEIAYTLKLMKLKPDNPITREIGAEICQRRNLKAYITGTISKVGSEYVLGLEAINGQTSELIAISQKRVSANDQKNVLDALSKAVKEIRGELGENLNQIAATDKPLAEVTTSSLEALKAYADATEAFFANDKPKIIEHGGRAVALDPEFAMAWRMISDGYSWSGNKEMGRKAIEKAYELKDRLSERERLRVLSTYYKVTGEVTKQIPVLKELRKKYPRDVTAVGELAATYGRIGEHEKSLPERLEAVRLEPRDILYRTGLINTYTALGRYEEAKKAIEAAVESGHKQLEHGWHRYLIAFIENDEAELEYQHKMFEKNPRTHSRYLHAYISQGKWKKANRIFDEKFAQFFPSTVRPVHAYKAALLGKCTEAMKSSAHPVSGFKTPARLAMAGLAAALCGDLSRTRSIIDEIKKHKMELYLSEVLYIPMLEALLELQKGNPQEAIRILEVSRSIKGRDLIHNIRGEAYLKLNENEKALEEFQIVLDNRGWNPTSVAYPLAQLGKARAMKSKEEYEKFFEMWKDADEDLLALVEAKKEYESLK